MTLPSIAVGGVAKSMIAVTISLHPAAAHHDSRSATVRAGDTLSSISQRAYGTAADWPAVWWANRRLVANPSLIRVGQRLSLPARPSVNPGLTRAALAAIPAPPPVAPAPVAAPVAAPVSQPASTDVASSAAPAPAQASGTYSGASGSYQSCVMRAESGGNAGAVNPSSGAGGLYGFLPSTWQALGFSGLPQNAPVSVQNAAFAKQYAASGTSAWSPYDGC
jgi:resuscitation-promoting factor RpfC